MNWITRRLFGRLPVGWLQLRHHRMRLAAAVAGVAFANMLVFVQLVILSAMNEKLRTARDLLLPRLMSGDVAV